MMLLILLLPGLMRWWQQLQCMEEEDVTPESPSPETRVRRRLMLASPEPDVKIDSLITKARTLVARLADYDFPGAGIAEVVTEYHQDKRFLRRTRYIPIYRDLVGWYLDDDQTNYLGRDGIIYQFRMLIGAYEPRDLSTTSQDRLKLIDRRLNQLAGQYLAGL